MRRATLVNSFAKGVIDPDLSERVDLSYYYNSLADAVNVVTRPQGGIGRRPGLAQLSDADALAAGRSARLRRRIEPVPITAAMITAHNGGTAANLVDQLPDTVYTVNTVAGSVWVLAEVDLGTSQYVDFIDVIGFKAETGRWDKVLAVEYWDGAAWVEVAGAIGNGYSARRNLRTSERTRRFGFWPGQRISARSWRVVLYDADGAGVITIGGLRMWRERRGISPIKYIPFARSTGLVYSLWLTDRNIDVYDRHRYLASIPVPVDAQQIDDINVKQSLDTLLMFHEDIATPRIVRQGEPLEWNVDTAAFTNVPTLVDGTGFAGDQDEVQTLYLDGAMTGDDVVLYIGDVQSEPITVGDRLDWADDVAAAINAMPGMAGDVTCELIAGSILGLRVTFTGGDGARAWPLLSAVVLGREGVDPVSEIVQRGIDGGGDLMGDTTGWARCGQFYQGRLLLGGFRSAPQTYGFSRVSQFYDFQITSDPLTADLGIVNTLDTDQLEVIHEIYAGRNLQLFTESGEWFIEARTIDATQPLNVVLATRHGLEPAVPLAFVDGATLFIQKGGLTLRDFLFEDLQQSYKAEPLSLLAPHLLTGVVDMAVRKVRTTSEANSVFMVNSDGALALLSLLRAQEVVAMTPHRTDGKFRAVGVDLRDEVWLAVERTSTFNGTDLFLERWDETTTLDGAVNYDAGGAATDAIGGLAAHEGKDVWAWADGNLYGPLVVESGGVTLPVKATRASVGLFPELEGHLPIIRDKLAADRPFRPPGRIYEVDLALAGTGQMEISVNGSPWREVPLDGVGALPYQIGAPPQIADAGAAGASSTQLERLVEAVCMIPAAGEFAYATEVVERKVSSTADEWFPENGLGAEGQPDFSTSLGLMRRQLPAVKRVSLFVAWFGTDLRCGNCELRPKVDRTSKTTRPVSWSVSGVTRGSAQQVSFVSGNPAYGGSPSDRSVIQSIQEMKAQGIDVVLTPFIMMDIASGNGLPDPYGEAEQAAFPWRGRITCHPAPGEVGTVDLTATAATQMAAFMGTAQPSDFTVNWDGGTVTPIGTVDWKYRRFVLHYAHLAKLAGGVDAFVIGSEMRGVSWVRDALGSYPYVTAMKQLAADVRSILGPGVKIVYAADWSEFVPHQTGVPGEVFFHLDPLWSDPNVDVLGIDNYWPLSDWRDGTDHLDYLAGWRSPNDAAYLSSNVQAGEGYDWFYASQSDRDDQVRTPITDGAYGKPWVWRYKDIKSWWLNQHYNRPAGVESVAATGWVPQSKPIWMMELGCPAVDRGGNQPNVFYDPKSSESFFPYYSGGVRDDAAQRAFLEAFLAYWTPSDPEMLAARNPASTLYPGRMVSRDTMLVYCWDARPYPAFPQLTFAWGDGPLWEFGHWLTGRVSEPAGVAGGGAEEGYTVDAPLLQRLVTGHVRLHNLRGWSRHPTIAFRQSIPAPLDIRSIRYEVSHHG